VGSCDHGNKSWDSTKDGEFLDYLSNYKLLKDSNFQSVSQSVYLLFRNVELS